MLTPEQESYILNHAYIPEHTVGLMTHLSEGEPYLADDFFFCRKDKWVVLVGYPLQIEFTSRDLEKAMTAGAEFIVSPVLNKDVIDICIDNNLPVFPGAFSPQEVCNAWELGATMVKVFPSSVFGPKYIKELKGPFDDIKIIAVGGVRLDNIKDFFESGSDAIAFGASVFRKEWIEKKDFGPIEDIISKYVNAFKSLI